MYEIIEPDFCYQDDRGSLVQLVHAGWNQINVVFPGKELSVEDIIIGRIGKRFIS